MKSQKEAVCNALLSVLAERGVEYKLNGEVTLKSLLTSDDKKKVKAIVIEGLHSGQIVISEVAGQKHVADGFKTYTNGLVDNWIKKNPEFNCGIKYTPKNPGSRAGQGDDKVRAMRLLLKTPGLDEESIAEINSEIAKRLAVIKPASVQAPINVDALPDHLKHLVTKS
ncbi:hypothetical protein KAR91_52335 [Candidatus Pacearchaeota archaeon]|nr:hypothetical protein [Candidatus Pacearchaeota archaeon]